MTETVMNKRNNPCRGCPDRYPACSDHCQKPEFLAWKAEQEKIRKNRAAYRQGAWLREEPFQPSNPIKRSKRKK